MKEGVSSQLVPIKEEVSTRVIESLIAHYKDPQQAFLELVDNAVDNKIAGKPIFINIKVARNGLEVSNTGGKGLNYEGLKKFFVWGYSQGTEQELGFYGVGGKAAMGYLGRSMEVVCSAQGETNEYRISDPSWESRQEGQWKTLTPVLRQTDTTDGYFRVRVTNLKRNIDARSLGIKLGDIYRPLLATGQVVMHVNDGREQRQVMPLEVRYQDDYQDEHQRTDLSPDVLEVETRFGHFIPVKIGILSQEQRIKPGIRLYYRGKLIEDGQYFGHPNIAQLPQVSKLIGEAFLDFVPVTSNKSDFDKGSSQWRDASARLTEVLAPWVEKVRAMKIEGGSTVENWEKNSARRVKNMLDDIFTNTLELSTRRTPVSDSNSRRKETRRQETVDGDRRTGPTGAGTGTGPKTPEGKTSSNLGVGEEGKDRRWNGFSTWEIVPMITREIRSEIVEEGKRQILKINSDFPMYQAARDAGEDALRLYIGETAIWKVVAEFYKDRSSEEIFELATKLLSDWGSRYLARIRDVVETGRKGK